TRDADVKDSARLRPAGRLGSCAEGVPGAEEPAAAEEDRPGRARLHHVATRQASLPLRCTLHRLPLLVHLGHLPSLAGNLPFVQLRRSLSVFGGYSPTVLQPSSPDVNRQREAEETGDRPCAYVDHRRQRRGSAVDFPSARTAENRPPRSVLAT